MIEKWDTIDALLNSVSMVPPFQIELRTMYILIFYRERTY